MLSGTSAARCMDAGSNEHELMERSIEERTLRTVIGQSVEMSVKNCVQVTPQLTELKQFYAAHMHIQNALFTNLNSSLKYEWIVAQCTFHHRK